MNRDLFTADVKKNGKFNDFSPYDCSSVNYESFSLKHSLLSPSNRRIFFKQYILERAYISFFFHPPLRNPYVLTGLLAGQTACPAWLIYLSG